MSSYPNDPPLPPDVLFLILGTQPDGSGSSDSSGSTTNYALYFSASVQGIFIDDRASAAETILGQAAMTGNRMMSQDDEQDDEDDSDTPTLDTTGLYLQLTNIDTAQAYLNLYNADQPRLCDLELRPTSGPLECGNGSVANQRGCAAFYPADLGPGQSFCLRAGLDRA